MTSNIATIKPTAIGAHFTHEQVELIKRTICRGATDDELRLFLYQCERTGLDPFARQIYSIERRENRDGQWVTTRSVQVSVDGLRLIAERSGKYAGQTMPEWCDSDGQWHDVWLRSEPPAAARVGVLRSDFKEPCWGVARFEAYAQRRKDGGLTAMWAKMPDVLILKCCEALAMRKAFPQELSGLYATEEMEQAGPVIDAEPTHHEPPKRTPAPTSKPVAYPELSENNGTKWMQNFTKLMTQHHTEEEVVAIGGHPSVVFALANAPTLVRQTISDLLSEAMTEAKKRGAEFMDADDAERMLAGNSVENV